MITKNSFIVFAFFVRTRSIAFVFCGDQRKDAQSVFSVWFRKEGGGEGGIGGTNSNWLAKGMPWSALQYVIANDSLNEKKHYIRFL